MWNWPNLFKEKWTIFLSFLEKISNYYKFKHVHSWLYFSITRTPLPNSGGYLTKMWQANDILRYEYWLLKNQCWNNVLAKTESLTQKTYICITISLINNKYPVDGRHWLTKAPYMFPCYLFINLFKIGLQPSLIQLRPLTNATDLHDQ